ncbi:universal stress protein [Variovorax paradoxus]|uniref:Universal stress protein family protein n=1 Tax=Variovorax paradoxus TaxID=34073 RepID=A0A0H2LXN9_VARPD|nr:universal stress protein [Variovorax paradoxus]KLN53272.1 universal stress protein family protein [Variovorax paradoxus]
MKILMPVDGSEYTRYMLDYAAAQGRWLGNTPHEVTFLTVVPPLPPRARGFMDEAEAQAFYRNEAAGALQRVVEFAARHSWQPTIVHRVGQPGRVIADMAVEEGFDLIVMGSHGHSALGALLLGSVTSQVLAQCRVPVLVVRR